MIRKAHVLHLDTFLYGKQLIENLEVGASKNNRWVQLPTVFTFNSSWKISHECLSCGEIVEVDQNFEESKTNFSILKNINSQNYSSVFLEEIAALFDSVELVEIEDDFYLNRKDFSYDFDFQRKSSVDVTHYSCNSCQADYLGLIRIGFPSFPEKGLETGRAGRVEVTEIVLIETLNGFDEYLEVNSRNLEGNSEID